MTKKIRIIVACGSGVATSTLAAQEVKKLSKEVGVDCDIIKTSMSQLNSAAKQADLVLTTNNYHGDLDKPYMSVIGFITGLKKEQLKKNLGKKLIEIANS